jgi:hypothetical protein
MGRWNVPVTWAPSAFKHGLTEDEIIYAMRNAYENVRNYGRPRFQDGARATLYIGPSKSGPLEVLAMITPPNGIHIFHAMPLRETTRLTTGMSPTATGHDETKGQGDSPGREPQEATYDDENT